MWWEILPSFGIVSALLAVPVLGQRTFNRLAHDGNPYKRDYTERTSNLATAYHRRDTQYSDPNFYQRNIAADPAGNGSVYFTHGLEAIKS
uniref:Uncharacterized protein n=1 Tax=Pseudodiaptomus poplesia TaxID=213370 RepID=A0A0U2KDH4_9MAXI|nr:hypothetical protein [Pseudodiaptomus poplesia]